MRGNTIVLVLALGCSSAPGADFGSGGEGPTAGAPLVEPSSGGHGGSEPIASGGTGGFAAPVGGAGGSAGSGGQPADGGAGGSAPGGTAGEGGAFPAAGAGGLGGTGGDGSSGGAPLEWPRPECTETEVTAYRVRPGECIWVHGRFAQLHEPTCLPPIWQPAVCDSMPGHAWDPVTERCYQGCAIVDNVHAEDRIQSFEPEPGRAYAVDRYEMVGGSCPQSC